jgi:hypothetical protein
VFGGRPLMLDVATINFLCLQMLSLDVANMCC